MLNAQRLCRCAQLPNSPPPPGAGDQELATGKASLQDTGRPEKPAVDIGRRCDYRPPLANTSDRFRFAAAVARGRLAASAERHGGERQLRMPARANVRWRPCRGGSGQSPSWFYPCACWNASKPWKGPPDFVGQPKSGSATIRVTHERLLRTRGLLDEALLDEGLPDEALMAAFQTGDLASFERLYDRHERRLRLFVRRYLANPPDG